MWSPSLEIFNKCLDTNLCNVHWDDPVWARRLGHSGPLQPDPFCDPVILSGPPLQYRPAPWNHWWRAHTTAPSCNSGRKKQLLMSVAHRHMFTCGSLRKEVRITPSSNAIYTNRSTQSIWENIGLCGLCWGQMKRGGGGWTSSQADENSGVFCNPSAGWQQSDMALTLKIPPSFAQQR